MTTALFDAVLGAFIDDHPDLPGRWILEQDLYTATARRALFSTILDAEAGWTFLDAGCGFGAVPLELAGQVAIDAHGIDADGAKIETAHELQRLLAAEGHTLAGNSVSLTQGPLESTPYESGTFDFVLANFVYQHLADPHAVTAEMLRILKAGGTFCIVDADDGISLVYPEPSEAYSTLSAALATWQERSGGDRQVGRKLASYLDSGGFTVTSTLVMPVAEYRAADKGDPGRRSLLETFARARGDIVSQSILSCDEFDHCMKLLTDESSEMQFRTNAQLIAIGRKPVA